MYYRSVNRGVTLTSPGRYTIMLVITLGLIAIGSGYNGIYLSLSMGFATLIISGLLSEKVMKHYEVQSLGETMAEPHIPFSLRFRATNRHSALIIYGIENLLFTEIPRFGFGRDPGQEATFLARWLTDRKGAPKPPLMQTTVLNLGPSTTREWSGTCSGLARGLYREFVMVQRTFFPFGLLAKFKVSRLPARVAIPPAFDEGLATVLRQELRGRLAACDDPREFHSHRLYTTRDSLRLVDWKKSAGHETKEWVLKQYEAEGEDFGLLIDLAWERAASATEEKIYERGLSAARTACEVARESGRPLALGMGGARLAVGYDAAISTLVVAPPFLPPYRRHRCYPVGGNPGGGLPATRDHARRAPLGKRDREHTSPIGFLCRIASPSRSGVTTSSRGPCCSASRSTSGSTPGSSRPGPRFRAGCFAYGTCFRRGTAGPGVSVRTRPSR